MKGVKDREGKLGFWCRSSEVESCPQSTRGHIYVIYFKENVKIDVSRESLPLPY